LLHLPFAAAFDGVVSTASFHWVLDHDRLFANLYQALLPGGWLEAQCGGGPNLRLLRDRADGLAVTPKFARYFEGFREPWLFQDATGVSDCMKRAGFAEVETSVEPALTVLGGFPEYREFVSNIILRQHLRNLPPDLRTEFVEVLAEQSAHDDPPFSLDYWRLNLRG
jgi:trans-aconitate 2-methyltransferase